MEAAPLVLLIGDDPGMGRLINVTLSSGGFAVRHETDGPAGLTTAMRDNPDIVLVNLSRYDSSDVPIVPQLTAQLSSPVVVLTDAAFGDHLLLCLKGGAFDILLRPFEPDELEAAVRLAVGDLGALAKEKLESGPDMWTRDSRGLVSLTEWKMLRLLAVAAGEPVLYQELITRIWGRTLRNDLSFLKAWIDRLRQKFPITEFHGVGYAMVLPPDS